MAINLGIIGAAGRMGRRIGALACEGAELNVTCAIEAVKQTAFTTHACLGIRGLPPAPLHPITALYHDTKDLQSHNAGSKR